MAEKLIILFRVVVGCISVAVLCGTYFLGPMYKITDQRPDEDTRSRLNKEIKLGRIVGYTLAFFVIASMFIPVK